MGSNQLYNLHLQKFMVQSHLSFHKWVEVYFCPKNYNNSVSFPIYFLQNQNKHRMFGFLTKYWSRIKWFPILSIDNGDVVQLITFFLTSELYTKKVNFNFDKLLATIWQLGGVVKYHAILSFAFFQAFALTTY